MKRYIKYIISIFSLSCIASCSINDEIANPNDGGHMSLRLVSSTMTRAEGDNDNSRNEDKLVSADLYFYASDGQDSTKNAKWHTKINIEGEVNEEHEITNLTLPSNIMQSVFGNGNSGYLYVIANYPSTATALPTYTSGSTEIANSSIKELAMYEATAQWGPSNASDKTDDCVQDSFLMAGASAITKSASNVEGTIYLTRAAAKIELTITGFNGLPEGGVEDGEGNHWLPDFITHIIDGQEEISIGAYVKLQNAVANSYVGAPMAAESYEYDETTAADGFYGYSTKADDGSYSQLIPFYSYSSDWSATGGANRASLLLVVPWKKVGTNEGQNCYYEIPIGARDNNLIERNKHYKVGVNVGTLGSFSPSEKVTITPAYITVVDWSTGQIDVNIAEARYLVVDENKVVMNNVDSYSVAYATSHDEIATIESIQFYDITGKVARLQTITSFTTSSNGNATTYKFTYSNREYEFVLTYSNGTLSLEHVLQNDINVANFDCVPYTINVNIHHADSNYADDFSEDIEFVQYPAMYIEAKLNSDYVDDNSTTNDYSHNGYVYVNGGDDYGGVHGLKAANKNPNMYVITTTALSDNTRVIGDPRVTAYNNIPGNSGNWSKSATAISGGSPRQLTYYLPTDNSSSTYNMIAPKFRVASSYGVTTSGSYADRQRRCASYQEDGYPAGRWRMPTKAELEYIVLLSAKGFIPKLFNVSGDSDGNDYWSAHGLTEPQSDGTVKITETQTGSYSVRCVYDEWYWGSEQIANKSTFTWGDKQR